MNGTSPTRNANDETVDEREEVNSEIKKECKSKHGTDKTFL